MMAEPSGGGSAHAAKPKARSNTLRQAASAVFALTAIVPLLLFLWTVHYLGALSELQTQVALGFALTIALLGFCIFRGLMDQMSDLILALRRVLELRERSDTGARASAEALRAIEPVAVVGARAAASPTRAARPPVAEPAPGASERAGVTAVPRASAPPAPPPANMPESASALERTIRPAAAETYTVPGFGAIREVGDLSRAMVVLWQAEAALYKGRRVVVSALRSPRPIIGTLIELTDDGLLVQTDESGRVAVSFDRISAIAAEKPLEEQ